jgi:hypothetical protein
VAPPQSAFERHVTQSPCTQKRAEAGHAASLVHVTHPSVASQVFGAEQPLPQRPPPLVVTIPPFGPTFELVPLHATATVRVAKHAIAKEAGEGKSRWLIRMLCHETS